MFKTGKDEGFKEILKKLDEETIYEVVPSGSISICPTQKKDGKLLFEAYGVWHTLLPSDVFDPDAYEKCVLGIPVIAIPESGLPFFIRTDRSILNEIGRLTPGGDIAGKALDNPKLYAETARYLDACLQANDKTKKITLCLRNGVVMAVRSGKFNPGKQENLSLLYDKIKDNVKVAICDYVINDDISCVRILFPEMGERYTKEKGIDEKLIPGLELRTSGLGYSAFAAQAIWVTGDGTFAYRKRVAEYHRGEGKSLHEYYEKLMKDVISQFETEANKLSSLFEISIPSTESAICSIISAVFKHCEIGSIFRAKGLLPFVEVRRTDRGKKYVDSVGFSLKEELINEFVSCGIELTAYDVAVAFLTASARVVGLPESYKQAFADACANAIDFDFKSWAETYAKKAPIVLTEA